MTESIGLDLSPHKYRRVEDPETGVPSRRLVEVRHLKSFIAEIDGERQPTIFLQGGKFYYEGGEELTEVPAWVQEQVNAMSSESRKAYGIGPKIGRPRKDEKDD